MRGVTTGRVIAAMTDERRCGINAIVEKVCDPMRLSVQFSAHIEAAIPMAIASAFPRPARVSFLAFYELPKTKKSYWVN
jgi:hypothetical protein